MQRASLTNKSRQTAQDIKLWRSLMDSNLFEGIPLQRFRRLRVFNILTQPMRKNMLAINESKKRPEKGRRRILSVENSFFGSMSMTRLPKRNSKYHGEDHLESWKLNQISYIRSNISPRKALAQEWWEIYNKVYLCHVNIRREFTQNSSLKEKFLMRIDS